MKQLTVPSLYRKLLVMACLLTAFTASANEYYWVGGSGNWSDFSHHWATGSGGSSFYLQVPTSFDNVHFDANSFTASSKTVTVDVLNASCNNMDWTGALNTPYFYNSNGSNNLNIGGSVTFISNMTLGLYGPLNFTATTTGQTINTVGKTINGAVNFNGIGGGWTLTSPFVTSGTITLLAGSLATNDQPVTMDQFNSTSSTYNRSLTMGASVFTITDYFTAWNISSTNFTLNAGVSTIVMNSTYVYAPSFYGGSGVYYDLQWTGTQSTNISYPTFQGGTSYHNVSFGSLATINSVGTISNLSLAKDANITGTNTFGTLSLGAGGTYTLGAGTVQTVGALTATGNCSALITLQSSSAGTQATISKTGGTVNFNYVSLKDIKGGGSAVFTASNSVNNGNNTNIAISGLSSRNLYWIGNGGNWTDGNHWSLTSGGSAAGCSPASVDNVFFDANSFTSAGQTVTMNGSTTSFNNMDWTGVTNTPSLTAQSPNTVNVSGSLILSASMNTNISAIFNFIATSTGQTISMFGKYLSQVNFTGVGGGWTLQSEFKASSTVNLSNGAWNTNNQPVTMYQFYSYSGLLRSLTLGTSVVTLTYPYQAWYVIAGNFTLSAGSSTIVLSYEGSGVTPEFDGGNFTYNDVSFTGTTTAGNAVYSNGAVYHNVSFGTGAIIGNGSNSFSTLTLVPGTVNSFGAGYVQTVGNIVVNGNCNSITTLQSTSLGTQATISRTVASGNLTLSYLSVKDIKTGGAATFTANNSINAGDNTGITFTTLTPRTLYWIGNGGNWNDGNHWSLTSGGVAAGCAPNSLDNVFFDANSFTTTGQTVTLNVPNALVGNMDWTGVTNTPTFSCVNSYNALNISGSLTLASAMNVSFNGTLNFTASTTGQTINTFGKPIGGNVYFIGIGGGWSLLSNFATNATGYLYFNNGSLTTNDKAITAYQFQSTSSAARTLNLGASVITLTYPYGNDWYISNSTNMTLNAGTSTIIFSEPNYYPGFTGGTFAYYDIKFLSTSASASPCTLAGGTSFHNVTFAGIGSISTSATFNDVSFGKSGTISGTSTYNSLTFAPGYTYNMTGTQTILTAWNATGTGSLPIILNGTGTVSKASGIVCNDYLRVTNMKVQGGAVFNVGPNGQDVSGNSGWNFAPNVTTISVSITPSPGCLNTPMTFTAIPVNGGTVSFEWFVNGVSVQNSTSTTYTSSTLALGNTVKCVMTSTFPCGTPIVSNSNTVTIVASPVVAAITGSAVVCAASAIQLSDVTASGVWSSTATGVATVTSSGLVTGVSAGTATILYSVTNANGCTTTSSSTVTVNALPTVSAITGTATICDGATTQLNDATTGGVWSSGNTAAATVNATGLVTAIDPGTAVISYTVTNANNCTTAVNAAVTVNAVPAVAAITGTTSVCAGLTAQLSNTTAGGTWSSSVPAVATISASGLLTGVAAGTTTISYAVTNASNCTTTVTIPVTVNALPAVATITGSTTVCANSTTQLNDATTGGTWTSDASTLATVDNTGKVSGLLAGAGHITYTVTNVSGCAKSAGFSITVTAAVPVTIIAGGPTAFCPGGSVTLTGSTAAGNSIVFTGSNYVESVNSALPAGNASRTLEAWIKVNSGGTGVIANWGTVTTNNRFGLLVSGNKLYFVGENNDLVGNITVADGTWHHVAVTFDGATIRLYVDGVADLTAAKTLATSGTTFRVGRRAPGDAQTEYLTGSVDEVRVWNVVRTQAQLQTSRSLEVAGASTGLVAYYKYNESTGTATADASSNHITATLNASPTFAASGAPVNFSSYAWTPGGATTQAILVNAGGNYTVTAVNAEGCSIASPATAVTINALPTATAASNSPIILQGTLNLTSSGGTAYSWTGPNSFSSTLQNPSTAAYSPVFAGTYTVSVANAAGCSSTASTTVTVITPLTGAGLPSNLMAAAAYSTRNINPLYTGPVMNVRRSSDNAQADVAFDANGTVSANSQVTITSKGSSSLVLGSTMSFGTFYAGTNCYVSVLRDLTGNTGFASQNTLALQPQIVNAGVLYTVNGKTAVYFNGSTYMAINNIPASAINAAGAIAAVEMQPSLQSGFNAIASWSNAASGFGPGFGPLDAAGKFGLYTTFGSASYVNDGPVTAGQLYVLDATWSGNGNSVTTARNGGAPTSGSLPTVFNSSLATGVLGMDNGSPYTGYLCEMIIMPNTLSTTDRQSMEANQVAYYLQSVTAGAVSGTISTCVGNASANQQQFTVSGANLNGNLVVTAPANFQVATTAAGTYASSVSLTPTAGLVAATTIYVRTASTAPAGTATGGVLVTSTGATTVGVTVTGTVNALPTVSSITGTTSVCIGSTAQLSDATAGGSWSSNSAFVASVNSTGLVTGNNTGTATITYTITDANGCSNSASTSITVNALPAAPTVSGTLSVCAGSGTVLTASSAAGSPVYNWYSVATGGASLYTGAAFTTPALTANTTYYAEVSNGSGCTSAARSVVTVAVTTLTDQTVTASPAAFCNSGSSTIILGSSQTGLSYTLRNNATNAIIGSPINGTGSAISFGTGTITASTTYNILAQALPSGALNVYTRSGYVSANGPALTISAGFTVEGWIYMNDFSNFNSFASQGTNNIAGPFDMYVDKTSGKMNFFVGNGSSTLSLSTVAGLSLSTWYHVAFVYDASAGKMLIYLNGVLNNSQTVTVPVGNSSTTLRIASRADAATNLNGKIDDFRIWNTARSAAQILANYSTCITTPQTGLSLYYKFDEPVGTSTVSDASGNGLNGTLVNLSASSAWTAGQLNCSGASNCTAQMNSTPTVTVYANPTVPAITGTSTVCIGATTPFTNTTTGGTWSSSNSAVATVNATGLVTGSNVGTATIRYSVTNANNCTTIVTRNVTVNALPTATAAKVNVVCPGGNSGSITVTPSTGTSPFQYSIDGGTNYQSANVFSGLTVGSYPVSIMDANGCANTVSTQTLIQSDNVLPSITAPSNITTGTDAGRCGATVALGTPLTADNCSVASVTNNAPAGNFFNTGATAVTWTVRDNSGNVQTAVQTVVVKDTENPVPDNTNLPTVTGECSATVSAPTATDNCSGTLTGTTTDPVTYNTQGTYTITWTYTDAAGNKATQAQTVIVKDVTPPTIVCAVDQTVVNTAGQCSAQVVVISPTVTDNCSGYANNNALNFDGQNDYVSIGNQLATNSSYTKEAWLYTKSTNASGNIISSDDCPFWLTNNQLSASNGFAHSGLTISDPNQFPVGQWTHVAVTYDASTHTMTLYKNGIVVNTSTSAPSYLTGVINLGEYQNANFINSVLDEVRIWNTARTAAQINANMNVALTGAPAGLVSRYGFDQGVAGGSNAGVTTLTNTQGNTAYNGAVTNFALTGANSNWVTGAPALSGLVLNNSFNNTSNASGLYNVGTTNVVWTATDAAGNVSTCTQVITVTAPDINLTGNGNTIAQGDVTPSASDNTDFGGTLPGVGVTKTFTVQNTGAAPLTVSAINISGTNAASFTKAGITLPVVIAANSSATFNVTFNSTVVGVKTATVAVVSNDCDEPSYNFALSAEITCTTPVFANTNPHLTGFTDANSCNTAISYPLSVGGIPTPTLSYVFTGATTGSGTGTGSGATFNKGVTNVSVTALNSCGSVVYNFDVTITDNVPPTITAPAAIAVSNDAGKCGASVNLGTPTFADNCGISSVTNNGASFTVNGLYPVGVTTVTWTVKDNSGLTATATQKVTVTDNEKPVASVGTLPAITGECAASITAPTATDNCAGTIIGTTSQPTSYSAQGTYTITWRYTDNAGNFTEQLQTVTVKDVTAPVVNCPANQSVNLDANCTAVLPDYRSLVTASDNCTPSGALMITQSPAGGTSINTSGQMVVTFSVTDGAGNTGVCAITVNKKDVTPPTFTSTPASVTTGNDNGNCGAHLYFDAPKAVDNCSASAFNFFNGGEPNDAGGEDYLELYNSGTWNDLADYNSRRGIIEFNSIHTTTPGGYSLIGNFGGHTYYIADAYDSWTNSRNAARAVGADLASINTYEEDIFLAPYGGASWVGGYQDHSDSSYAEPGNESQNFGGWKWVDGTRLGTGHIAIVQTQGLPSGSLFPIGTTTNTWTATDEAGNTTSYSQTIVVTDVEGPSVSAPDININLASDSCSAIVTYDLASSMADCTPGTNRISYSIPSGSRFNIGSTPVTVTTTDVLGNVKNTTFNVNVNDVTAPALTAPADIKVKNDQGQCGAVVSFAAAATDCSAVTVAYSQNPGTQFAVGVTVVTITATDASNNVSTATFNVTVIDSEPPVISNVPRNIVRGAGIDSCGTIVTYNMPTASENCAAASQTFVYSGAQQTFTVPAGVTFLNVDISGAAGANGSYSYGDEAGGGYGGRVQAKIPVSPGQVLYLNVGGQGQTTNNGYGGTGGYNGGGNGGTYDYYYYVGGGGGGATDIRSGGTDLSNRIVVAGGGGGGGYYGFGGNGGQNGNDGYSYCCYTPGSGATQDGVGPTGNVGGLGYGGNGSNGHQSGGGGGGWYGGNGSFDWSSGGGGSSYASVDASGVLYTSGYQSGNGSVTFTWINPATITQTAGLPSGSVFPVGTTTNTFTAADAAGNTSTASFDVTVTDDQKPTFTCPADFVHVPAFDMQGTQAGYIANYAVTDAHDNCGVKSIEYSIAPGSFFPVGNTPVTVTVTDVNGNKQTCTFHVIVDCIQPVFVVCPSNIIANTDAGVCTGTVNYTAIASGRPSLSMNYVFSGATTGSGTGTGSGSVFNKGTTTVTITANNLCSIAICSFTITVVDNQPPVIVNLPANIVLNNEIGTCGAKANWAEVSTTDNCGAILTGNHVSGEIFPVGSTTITYTSTDGVFITTGSFTVTVVDNEKPTITAAANQTQTADAGDCGANVVVAGPTTHDNCDVQTITNDYTHTSSANGHYPVGTTTITWTVTDIHGNTNTATQTVTVTDNEKPTITAAANQTQTADAGDCGANVVVVSPATHDNCDVQTVTNDYTHTSSASGHYPVGTTTIVWTVTDIHGNTNTATQTVTVTDNEKPTITAAANQAQTADAGDCGANVVVAGPVTHDNCDVQSVTNDYTHTSSASGHYPVGTTTITWTVTDIHGNTNTATQTVTVTDNEKPTITAAANQTQTADAGDCGANVVVAGPVTHDNCDVQTVTNDYTHTSSASGHYPVGMTTIVWTVTDIHGNTNTATQTVTVTDNERPVIVNLPHNITVNALTGNCSTLVGWTKPTATDNCGIASIVSNDGFYEQFGFSLMAVGVNTVTYTVTDIHGNQSSASFTVTVVDNQPPIITGCPSNIRVEAAAGRCDQVVNWNPPTASDNCPGVSLSTTHLQGETFPLGSTTVVYTATDHAGLTTTCSFTVTVVDTQKPVLNGVPANTTVECDAVPAAATVTATDNCATSVGVNYTETRTNGNCPSNYTLTRTWSATDASGNTGTATQVVTVQDTKAPVLSAAPANTTVECDAVPVAAVLTATDNCDAAPVVTYTETRTNGNCPSNYTLTRTWTATDACGNASSKTQVITVQDTKAPVLSTAPANTTVECDAVPAAAVLTATDNCDAAPVVTYTETRTNGNCPSNYTLTRTWTATDACGNTSSKKQVITVQDTKAPVLSAAPANTIVECDALPAAAVLTATDNCDAAPVVTYNETRTNGNCPSSFTLTRTWTATDACGNTSSKTQTIIVQDTKAPVLSPAPADITVECDAVPVAAVLTATDNCDAAPVVTYNETRTNGNCPSNYTLTRTWTATDACGNASSKTQVVTVQDTKAPVLSAAPANTTVECDAVPAAAVLTATDNCDAAPVVTYTETRTNGNCPSNYTLTRTWTATDACGNASSKTQVITVQDTQAPVLSTAPASVTVECDAVPTAAVLTATDNCDAAPVVTFTETRTNGNCPSNYTLTRTWTATDACGNASSKTQTIIVQDTTAPVLSGAPANTTVECDAVPVAAVLTATDNCDAAPVVTYTETRTSGNCPSSYTLTRTWTATDACGNASSKTQIVTVQDTQAPVLSAAPANTTVECDAVPTAAILTATDNCDAAPVVTYTETRANGNCPSNYTLTRTWTATDACGNASSKTQVITVQDTQAPVLSVAPASVTVECDAVPTAAILTATDNCDAAPVVTYTETRINGNCPSNYTLTRTWTATDACGNANSKTQLVTVQDTQAPVLSAAPANTTVECDAVPTAAILTATDNCDAAPVVTFTETRTNGNCPSNYTLTRTWTATDACGNASSKTQTIIVQDTNAPVLSAAPANTTVECDAVPVAAVLTATDNCDAAPVVTYTETRTNGTCPSSYTLTRTWTATDACGNACSKTQVVTVQDTQAPVLTPAPASVTVECDAVPVAAVLTATDNCDAAPVVTYTETRTNGNCPSNYTLTRTWTATDACGNASSKTQTIIVQDTKAPVLSAAPANTTVECDAVPVAAVLTATDNCDAAPVVTYTETRTNGNCPSSYTLTRIWTATDACGNASSKTQTIIVQDTKAPVLSAAPANTTVQCDAVPVAAVLTATDNCDAAPVVTYTETRTNGNCPSNYTLTRKWTATDACGNACSKTQVITVQDTKAPVLSAAPANTTVECDAVPVAAVLTATDNCDAAPVVTYTETRTNGNCPSNYTLTRKWTATDACGNACSKTQVITVQDTKAPVLSAAPVNTTVQCDAVPVAAVLTATDNCDAAPVVTYTETRTNGNCPSNYTLTRTWTATDACGNSSSKAQTIIVQDTKAPVLSAAPANTTVECDAVPVAAVLTATDNCDAAPVVTYTETRTNGNCPSNYTLTRKWTATDACGNACSKTQVITVQDTKAPVLSAAPANTTVQCDAVPVAAVLTATDNCDAAPVVTYTETRTNGNCPSNYTLTRKWTATDACGNACSKTQVITVQDTKAPVLSAAPASITVQCDAVPAAAVLTATDNCSTPMVVFNETRTNGSSAGNYTLTRNWTATDPCGNTASVSQTITVQDTKAPVPNVAVLPTLTGDCSVTATAPLATDNCAGTITAATLNPVSYTAQGVYTITWTYSDGNGNSSSQTQRVVVKDQTPPVPTVAVLPTVNGQCSAVVTTKPTATDACSGVTAAGTTTDPLSYSTQGTYTIHWTYTDNYGNKSYQNQTVVVKDTMAPVPVASALPTATGQCSAGVVIITGCTDNCTCCRNGCHCRADNCNCKLYGNYGSVYAMFYDWLSALLYGDDYHDCDHDDDDHSNGSNTVYIKTPTATDNCKGTITGTTTDPLTYSTQGTYTIHWKFDDGNGNVSVQEQTVVVKDNTAPVASASSLPTVYGVCSATVTGKPTATDNCKGTITATTTDPLSYSGNGTYTIHWTYNDGNGNTTTQNQTVVVNDNIKPNLSEPNDVTVSCSSPILPSVTGMATATDNCSTPVITYTDVVNGNRITRTWKATDAAGNYDMDVQYITLIDNTKPVITAPSAITVNCGSSTAPAATGTATATDNCSTPVITYADNTNGYVITRTWKATDGSGNYATATQTITITDNVKPVITAPSNTTISCSGSSNPSVTGTATATDNCSSVTITYSDVTGGNTITRTWKATDASGNYATAVQTLTSVDNTAPVLRTPSNVTVNCGSSTAPSATGTATATDNCSTPTITYSDATNGYVTTRTWKAMDASGNTVTGTQTITVVDNTKPVLTEPNDITINCGGSTLPSATGMATATDNCSTPVITYSDVTNGNVITRTWKATDASGNYDADVQYITVGSPFTASVTSAPTNGTFTGGVSTNLYLGYGAQSTTLQMCSLPSSGAPYTYKWTGTTAMLSSTTSASPVFTPASFGYYAFTATVTNKYGCTSAASISICVTDIRVAGTNGAKVYVCHTTYSGHSSSSQTLQVTIAQVPSHIGNNTCGSNGNDRLGSCDQSPCNTTVANATVGTQSGKTLEGADTKTVSTTEDDLKVTVMPNPTTTYFTLKIESRYETPVNLRVMDAQGRVIDAKSKIGANSTIQIGHGYSSGTYYAELIQGNVRKVVQMVKGRG